jgi:tetratricopeptide (TPR) repeat protein
MSKNKNLTIQETFSLAVKNHQEGKIDIAQELYNQVLKIDPSHSQSLVNIAVIFSNLKEHQKAKEIYEKAIEINPNFANAHNNLGNTFQDLGENQKAKECYEKAIEINPNHSQAHNNLGIIFKKLEDYNKAKEIYEKAIEIDPNYANTHNNLGNVFKELGDYNKAKECYEKAIEIDPNHSQAYNNLGVIFKELGDYNKAKECFEKAIKINPNYVDAYNNLGVIFKELGENQKAKECYEKAIEIDPNYANTHNNLGNVFKELGDYNKAKECYEKAIKINPNYANAHNNLLKSLFKLNNQSILFKKLDSITKEGKINAVIGSIFSRAKAKYGFKKENPFCNDPLDYVLKTDLIEKYDFNNVIVDCVYNILKNDSLSNRTQTLITNGYQTAGNLFTNEDFNTKEIQRIIHVEIEKYRLKFKDSKEGFINNWPTNYNLTGWLISLKKGGKLKAHMHDLGWLSGSIYVNVPPKLQTDSGNLVVCIDENENEKNNNKNKKSINVVNGSLCLFPSSLLHYTIPFEAEEERIVLAFDMMPLNMRSLN